MTDRVFLADHAEGWEQVERDALEADWGELVRLCGVGRQEIDQAVERIGAARRGIGLWAMGLTHHKHGCDNIQALANLVAARGWIGRPGCGLMPIRGHSNIQGVGSVGFAPGLKRAFAEEMERAYGIPSRRGLDTYHCMEAAAGGRMQAAVLLGGNLYASNPDLDWAGGALRRIGTTAYLTTKLNQGHVHGRGRCNLVLPVLARDEERQPTTQESMFNFVRLSEGGQRGPVGEPRSEVELICALAARLLPEGPFPFERMTDHTSIRQVIAQVVPGYAAMGEIDRTRNEFQIAGRTFHEPRFNTDSGKLRLQVPPTRGIDAGEDEFRLMTLRSEGQFNTVVYEEEDIYRGNRRRDVVMISRWDGERLGLGEFDPVTVESAAGKQSVLVAFAELPPGNAAMYYPEANSLVPRSIDPESGTPAFKSVVVRIVK
jgi:molybdopterin-dependent oxidoreductase alpha subunit